MKKISCPICNNEPNRFFHKGNVLYSQCASCKTVFCDALDQEGLVGGEHEEERNNKENYLRIARIEEAFKGLPKEDVRILDFGCGNGMLINDLKEAGYKHVDGYDSYNPKYQRLPQREYYHAIISVECIEHMSHPFTEIEVMHRSLVNYGIVMLESGYIDVAYEDGIPIEDYFYIAPKAGHSTIFSHHGIDVLMCLKSFAPRQHINRHVRAYSKIPK